MSNLSASERIDKCLEESLSEGASFTQSMLVFIFCLVSVFIVCQLIFNRNTIEDTPSNDENLMTILILCQNGIF